jgi:hypothetical protein
MREGLAALSTTNRRTAWILVGFALLLYGVAITSIVILNG